MEKKKGGGRKMRKIRRKKAKESLETILSLNSYFLHGVPKQTLQLAYDNG